MTHENTTETWGIYEVAAGVVTKVRWQRSKGHLFKIDDSFTPDAVLDKWDDINDFTESEYPNQVNDFIELAEKSAKLTSSNSQGSEHVSFRDQVVIVTGAGAGIGRAYALALAKLGAKVVVNDFANPHSVVEEIKKAGGIAVADSNNVVDGAKVVKTAIENFGSVHAVVNNAGIVRDKSFTNMTDKEWDQVMAVHLFATYAVTKAAWPYFLKQKYGRVLNTASTSGIYGNFGQANYAAAKLGILGFSKALALEGAKYNILVNTIAPNAGTGMTKAVFTEEMMEMFKPEYIAPLTVLLSSDKAPTTGHLFEIGSGWIGRTRWERTGGVAFNKHNMTLEKVAENWPKIVDFEDRRTTHPESAQESNALIELAQSAPEDQSEQEEESETGILEYDQRDIILYNLGIGASAEDLKYVYENHNDFGPVPSFGVVPFYTVPFDYGKYLPNFNPMMLLHGEQYLEVLKWPIPSSATLETSSQVLDVIDKGKASIIATGYTTKDRANGESIFYNVASMFVRGSGGLTGEYARKYPGLGSKPAATASNKPPARAPDYIVDFKVGPHQAALYRLSGDYNPLHIDKDFAAVGNFPRPILHGLCTMGISTRLLVDKFGILKNVKVRFTGHVFPGETLRVQAWKQNKKVIFETLVVERNTKAISAAAIELASDKSKL